MMDNIFKMIEDLDSNSTVGDFKSILKLYKEDSDASLLKKDEEVKELTKKMQELIEASIKRSAEASVIIQPNELHNKFFHAAMHDEMDDVLKFNGKMIKNDEGWTEKNWDINKKSALGTVLRGDTTTGSYLVPIAYEAEVFRLAKDASVMMGKIRSIDMATRDIYWPAENAFPSLTWVTGETTAKTETSPTFAQIHLECETCAAWLTVTDELLEDSLVNLGDFFKMQFVEAWGMEFDKQVLNSNASPFTGILHNSSVNVVNMGVGKVNFEDVEFDDLIDMETAISTAKGERALAGAVYIMHRKTFNSLKKKKDDNGDPIYMKASDGVPATINGYPYIISDQMPSTSVEDTGFIALGNPKYWIHGNRIGMQFRTYNNTIRNVDYDQIFYKFRIRQGFVAGIAEAFAVLKTADSS